MPKPNLPIRVRDCSACWQWRGVSAHLGHRHTTHDPHDNCAECQAYQLSSANVSYRMVMPPPDAVSVEAAGGHPESLEPRRRGGTAIITAIARGCARANNDE